MDEAEADSKIEYQKRLDEMSAKRDEAEAQLKEIAEAGDDAWDDVKAGFGTEGFEYVARRTANRGHRDAQSLR